MEGSQVPLSIDTQASNLQLAELVGESMLYKNLAYIGDNQQLSVTGEEIHDRKHNKSTTRVIQKGNREVGQTPLSFIAGKTLW